MSKEEITKHKSETHEVAVALSRACPGLALALRVPVLSFIDGVEGVIEWVEGSNVRDLVFEFSFSEIHNCHT